MNQLSPRRSPRKPIPRSPMLTKTPPHWKKPEDVMRNRKLRLKRTALTARMNKCETSPKSLRSPGHMTTTRSPIKRKNPFRRGDLISSCSPKKSKETKLESSSQESLNQIFGLDDSAESASKDWSFLNFSFESFEHGKEEESTYSCATRARLLPIDWTLRLKMKFYSASAFPWNPVLKTCEEASGVTGFVRCIDSSGDDSPALDTSPSARFHQYNLYWQHPHLPWLELYPRTNVRRSGEPGKAAPVLTLYPSIKDSLLRDWTDSFRSLFQLLRARHCPYFYVVGNSFNCLFRAAGINGCSETTVFVSPTTVGFRKLMLKEAISFSMPLKPTTQRRSNEATEDADNPEADDEDVDDDTEDKWLESLNVQQEDLKNINISLNNSKEDKTDPGNDSSLVLIEGSEVSSFFNFLINCKTLISLTGPLAGVPPTLLSPVGFCGGSLMSLKAKRSVVKVKNDAYHTIELTGPILPHTVHNLCSLLNETCNSYSTTFVNLDTTKSFATASSQSETIQESPVKTPSGRAFNVESLNDCGFKPQVLASFCSQDTRSFDCIKYSEGLFACS